MDALLQDVHYAIRRLVRSPGFAITAILTLALGIGGNSALLSIANRLFWKAPVGVAELDGLSWVSHAEGVDPIGISYADYLAFRDSAGLFDELALLGSDLVGLAGGDGAPQQRLAELVSGNYFAVLGTRLELGRGFTQEEGDPREQRPVAVVSHSLWQERFAGRSDVIGYEVLVNGVALTIVGVAPPGFRGFAELQHRTDVWVPFSMHQAVRPSWTDLLELEYGLRPFYAFGRLREGLSRDQAEIPLQLTLRAWGEEFPDSYGDLTTRVLPFKGVVGPQMRPQDDTIVLMMAGAVTLLILLIACGNLANLLLARAAGRTREIAVRAAIGASRNRIVRQLLVEALVLSLLGGGVGVLVAMWMVGLLEAYSPLPFPVPLGVDVPVVAATFGLSLLTGVVFGLAPAVRASRPELTPALKLDGGGGRDRTRIQRVLIAGQLALSFVLLMSAALLVQSMLEPMAAARSVAARDEVVTVAFNLRSMGYSDEARADFQRQLIDRVEAIGGVEAASLTGDLPSESSLIENRIAIDTREISNREMEFERQSRIGMRTVWPQFFTTLEIPIVRGRDFTDADRAGSAPVVVINRAMADRYWPGQDALGRLLRAGPDTMQAATIIGIIENTAHDLDRSEVEPVFYKSELQDPGSFYNTILLVRTRGSAAAIVPTLRQVIASIDPGVALHDVRTLGEVFDDANEEGRLATILLAVFGTLAMTLAMIGLYGVVAYAVAQRTREMGIRIALGAGRGEILALFGRDTFRVASYGILAGLLLVWAVSRAMASAVGGVSASSALTVGGTALLLLGVAVLTSLIPARRATRVDPIVALRAE